MSNYQLRVLLEALISIHTFEEFWEPERIILLLIRQFSVSEEEAEAIVEGALHLKAFRARTSSHVGSVDYLQ